MWGPPPPQQGYAVILAPSVEKTTLPPLNCFCTFVKSPPVGLCRSVCEPRSAPFPCVSVPSLGSCSRPPRLDSKSENRMVCFLQLDASSFQSLAMHVLLPFPVNVKISLSVSTKNFFRGLWYELC